jgi:hypothetical protein
MTAFSSDYFLLLIVLIITIVSLFLCLYTALLLFDVSKGITRLMSRPGVPKREGPPGATVREQRPAAATSREEIGLQDFSQEYGDIATGIGTIVEKYHIDSLVVAMPDGLVVASAGSSDPDYDAAHYSDLFTGGFTMPDQGVWLLPLDHRGIPMIGIARNRTAIPEKMTTRIAEEITLLFERGL